MALSPMLPSASPLPRSALLHQQQQSLGTGTATAAVNNGAQPPYNATASAAATSTAAAVNVAIPRRRVSYLIPPPPASQPPPLLALPVGNPQEIRSRKRGNPNPLIILANPEILEEDNQFSGSSANTSPNPAYSGDYRSSRRRSSDAGRIGQGSNASLLSRSLGASTSSGITSASSKHYHSNNTTVQRHPEHTLGITALALDTSTIIDNAGSSSARKTPGGILYSGGRDGLVASWELGLPFKQRDHNSGFVSRKGRRRRYLPRWAEDSYTEADEQDIDEDDSSSDEETHLSSAYRKTGVSRSIYAEDDNDAEESLLDDDTGSGSGFQSFSPQISGSPRLRLDTTFAQGSTGVTSGLQLDLSRQREGRRQSVSSSFKRFGINGQSSKQNSSSLPYESRWTVDTDVLESRSYHPPSSSFRQAHRGHTNWVNDIVLCNLNQTVISASSDRMIRAWNPHDPHRSMLPAALGSHNDYVKCLAHARESGWIASGGFDKKVKIWDIMESRQEPILDYNMTGSVYALASNPSGSTIVAGSPEKVVRIYDPRASRSGNPVAGLVGHADNVRALLVSEDGRHVVSASSDSTVKVWSVSMRRCLHTFTHHSESVWSLFSSHPDLEIFYSGDRTGTVCKVDFENAGDIPTDGECVILLRNRDESKPGTLPSANDGIHRIVAVDDTYLWTASSSSNICRWKDIPRKSKRMAASSVPALSRHDTLIATTKHYPASIPEHEETPSTVYNTSIAPIPIKSPQVEESPILPGKLSRARSNSSISRERVPGSQFSVAFAAGPTQRSSPGASSPIALQSQQQQQQRPSSLRFSNAASNRVRSGTSYSSSPPTTALPLTSPPKTANDELYATALTSPATPVAASLALPALNYIPLESLVPLFTLDDPYGASSGYGISATVGYSASVLSLHRTNSRPMAGNVTSPFTLGSNLATTPSSGLSAPRVPLSFTGRSTSPMPGAALGASASYHRPSSFTEEDEAVTFSQQKQKSEAYMLAQQEYEDRESALDGIPLRSAPDDVIRGRSGLVRAELLNDRRTVISLDTQGEVAVWDILLGTCIGCFAKQNLRKRPLSTLTESSTTSHGTTASSAILAEDFDVLESIRSQIEGEALVQSWCSVECRTGLLTVHIDQSRAFDAEVYLDESGLAPKPEYRVDQRLNLGKWILRNLFDAFIAEEVKLEVQRERSGSVASGDTASTRSNSSTEDIAMSKRLSSSSTPVMVPSHITLPDAQLGKSLPDSQRLADMGTALHPGGFSTALATPAMTPAILPNPSDLASQLASPRLLPSVLNAAAAPLSPIAQSPNGASTVPATPMSAMQRGDGDYFSRPRTIQSSTEMSGQSSVGGMPTPKAGITGLPLPPIPSSVSPATKMSKMSRFKSFGKRDTPKKDSSVTDSSLTSATSGQNNIVEAQVVEQGSASTDSKLSPLEKKQKTLLAAIFSHPLQPPAWHETPPILFGADLPVMIEEESHDAGAWATIYRNTASALSTDVAALEMCMPQWLLEFTCHNLAAQREPVKIAFILEPHGGADKAGFDALPSGNARLSATRMLRMRKACHYVAEKLELESWKQRQRYQNLLEGRRASHLQATNPLARTSTKTSLTSSNGSYTHFQNDAAEGIEEPTLLPEEEVEILCHNEVVPLNMTLAACAKYCYGKGGDVYLTYRRRELDPNL